MKNRIYGDTTIELDKTSIKNVFETVAKNAQTTMSSCMLDMKNKYAEERHRNECEFLSQTFRNPKHVLDIGCGIGRLRSIFPNSQYTGVDFCERYIKEASDLMPWYHYTNTRFIQSDVTKIPDVCKDVYSLVLMCGIFMYLSDVEITNLLTWLKTMPGCSFYIRESVSMITGSRLTLKDFPSEDLGIPYSAVYRTPAEYTKLILDVFPDSELVISKPLQEKQLRKETNQLYFIWKK